MSGGSRLAGTHSHALVYHGSPRVAMKQRMFSTAPTDAKARECPRCHFRVAIRKDGTLYGHVVGTSRRNSYPCPGEDYGTP